tara:strand:+ start:507 stop:686 length:180 start_codon:yes stop_codon:yes gene_type:complete
MKLSYKTKDRLIKIGFILMLVVFVLGVGYSYVECQATFVESVLSEAPENLEESIKSKIK